MACPLLSSSSSFSVPLLLVFPPCLTCFSSWKQLCSFPPQSLCMYFLHHLECILITPSTLAEFTLTQVLANAYLQGSLSKNPCPDQVLLGPFLESFFTPYIYYTLVLSQQGGGFLSILTYIYSSSFLLPHFLFKRKGMVNCLQDSLTPLGMTVLLPRGCILL